MYAIIDSDDEGWMDVGLESPPRRREKPPVDAEVVDLEAEGAAVVEQLSQRLERDSEVLSLAALHAAQKRRAERRSGVPAHAEVIDVDDAASTDLLYEQRQRLPEFLRDHQLQLPATDVTMNPHSFPGTKLYERFFAAWAQVPNKSMRLVFHGTSEDNIEAICAEGLDPKRRRGQALGPGEYFAGTPGVSLGYCRGGRKMLVFCILIDASGVTSYNEAIPGGIAVIHKPEHQLPLAVVTFDPGKLPGALARRAADAVGVPGPARRARKPMSESKRWFYGIDGREKRRRERDQRVAAESQRRNAAQGLLQLSAPAGDATAAPAEDATAAPAEDATAAPADDTAREQREVEASMYDGMTDEQMLTLLGV